MGKQISNGVNLEIIEVETGKVKAARAPAKLRSSAIGSCVAVILYDSEHHVGGIAHVMLPSTDTYIPSTDLLKYANFAIEELLKNLMDLGATKETLRAKLVGGAMIVRDSLDIGKENIKTVEHKLKEMSIEVLARRLGGYERRSVTLDNSTGVVWVSEGGEKEKPI